ncbi:MAG: site-specific integrase [Okeania sp. SIO3B3]|nr:site-specific integrase [Okeania sp. SIO3B3]
MFRFNLREKVFVSLDTVLELGIGSLVHLFVSRNVGLGVVQSLLALLDKVGPQGLTDNFFRIAEQFGRINPFIFEGNCNHQLSFASDTDILPQIVGIKNYHQGGAMTTLESYLNAFTESLTDDGRRPRTIDSYVEDVDRFISWFTESRGSPPTLETVSTNDIKSYQQYMQTEPKISCQCSTSASRVGGWTCNDSIRSATRATMSDLGTLVFKPNPCWRPMMTSK